MAPGRAGNSEIVMVQGRAHSLSGRRPRVRRTRLEAQTRWLAMIAASYCAYTSLNTTHVRVLISLQGLRHTRGVTLGASRQVC